MNGAALVLVFLCTLCSCSRFEGAFSFLREPPKTEQRLPGTYVLDASLYSYSSLKKEGYSDLSATIRLRLDGTFSATRIPDCCVYGEYGYFGGYFDGSGTWSVVQHESVFDVRFQFAQLRRNGATDIKQPTVFRECSFTITKGKPSYGLAAPLFDGEFKYAYFQKKKED